MLQHTYFKELLDLYPSLGAFLGHRDHDDVIENPLSPSFLRKEREFIRSYLRDVRGLNRKTLRDEAFEWFLKHCQENNFAIYLPLTPFDNYITNLIFMSREFYPKNTDNLVKRYHCMIDIMDACIIRMQQGIQKGIVLPRKMCLLLLKDLKQFYKNKVYVIHGTHIKGYQEGLLRVIRFIQNDYLKHCVDTMGLCHLPKGKEVYKQLIVQHSTLTISPQEVFRYGLTEVDRLLKEFNKLQIRMGHGGMLSEFHKYMMASPLHYLKSKDEVLRTYRRLRQRVHSEVVKEYFHHDIIKKYDILSIPKDIESSSVAAYYYPGNFTSGSKGRFYVNTRDLKGNPTYSMYVLSIHEGSPGHHFQFQRMIEAGLKEHDVFAFDANGFVEGWALYVESLGKYSDTEYYGKLCFEMLRAVRLVVDVGIHYYGWSWNKAWSYMTCNIPMSEAELRSELIRYVCNPGQAVAYKLGEKVFKELRDLYLSCGVGDVCDYHEEVLKHGIMPMDVLKRHFTNLCSSKL